MGGQFIPYEWYLALRDADTGEAVSSASLVRKYGLIVNPNDPDGLPIGFGKTSTSDTTYLGYNCFACHTSEIRFGGSSRVIDGGGSMADFFGYIGSIVSALVNVSIDPTAFDAFAPQVLGNDDGPVARAALYTAVGSQASYYKSGFVLVDGAVTVREGFGRADATGRGAVVIGLLVDPAAKVHDADAPTGFPSLWGTPRFAWNHYGAGVRSLLGRNVAQAIANFTPADPSTGESDIPLENLKAINDAIALLQSPTWSTDYGPIDATSARHGGQLYQAQCAKCHGDPAASSPLEPPVVPVATVGTDPNYVRNFTATTLDGTTVGLTDHEHPFAIVERITSNVIDRKFADLSLTPAEQEKYTGGRPNTWRAPPGYKANPLIGIWATAPYLHNNSVPTLSDLLLPVAQRPKSFRVGPDSVFDPVRVGVAGRASGGFLVDTKLKGNSNAGHEYGTDLSDADRTDLVEYLKTL
jgi:hypothetical protein